MNSDQRRELMQTRVEHLASPELEGRAPGTPGGLLARAYVEAAFTELGLTPAGENGYQQPIPEINGANLLGVIPGTGPHADRYIVLNAHYDHLGINFGNVYPGADDNASGVAVLLDVANQLIEQGGLDRSVLIMSVDAEEPPHFYEPAMGSIYFVDHPTVPLDKIDMMVNLDLIGHPLGPPTLPPEVRNTILVMGAEKSPGVGAIIDRLSADTDRIFPRRLDADIIPPMSDHYAFQRAEIPFLFFNIGRDRHYHTPEDTAEKLDYPKMVAVADYLAILITELAGREAFTCEAGAVDDTATLTTLADLGRHAGPLHRKSDQVMALVGKLEKRLEAGTVLSSGDRGTLRATILALEEALK